MIWMTCHKPETEVVGLASSRLQPADLILEQCNPVSQAYCGPNKCSMWTAQLQVNRLRHVPSGTCQRA